MITYAETLFKCVLSDFVTYGGMVIPNTPISFKIAHLFEYDVLAIFTIMLISISIRACKWNLYATMYLILNIAEKYIFVFEVELSTIYVVSSLNLFLSGFFVFKGIQIFLKQL